MRMKNKYCFGIDIGGTSIKAGLFQENGTLIQKYEIPTRKSEGGNVIFEDVATFTQKVLAEHKLDIEDIIGIGMGVPGAVTDSGIVNKCINLGWGVIDAAKIMQQKTGFPVKVGNDANMAALGEYWKGGACGYSSIMLITVGTGVGGGIIIHGNPLNGYHGAAAEIGHLPVALDAYDKGILHSEDICNCGKRGCLEQVGSATGIVRVAKRMLALSDMPSILRCDNENDQDITAKDVFDAAKKGDELAIQIAECVSRYLGIALACAAGVVDAECFIVGGGVSAAGTYFTELIEKYYKQNAFHASSDAKILAAKLGNDAGIYGAAKLILE